MDSPAMTENSTEFIMPPITKATELGVVCGIDPGLSGGMAFIDQSGCLVNVIKMPIILKEYDLKEIIKQIKHYEPRMIAIERQQSMHKQGLVSTFTTGKGFGMLQGIAACLAPFMVVNPKDWQKEMLTALQPGDTKKNSMIAAQRLFPTVSFLATDRCKVIHDGMTDACLLAEYTRRKLYAT